jgi:hypothetical protein
MLVIEERCGNSCDEELRTIGIRSSVLLICQWQFHGSRGYVTHSHR